MLVNEIAAYIHKDMVDDDRNGYSWEERNGYKTSKVLTLDGHEYIYKLGDRDCSSSVIEAWTLALKYTPYNGALSGAITTHNIRSVFKNSGLFDVWPLSKQACLGDLFLNDANHVAMCQGVNKLSEFSWGDNGAYGNKRGDQSGNEARINNYYSYPWDCIMHYNGKADTATNVDKSQVKYCCRVDGAWLSPMYGRKDSDPTCKDNFGGILGLPIQFLAIADISKYRVKTTANSWLPWVSKYELSDLDKGCAGDGSAITGIELKSDKVKFGCHTKKGWSNNLKKKFTSNYAIDGVWFEWA